MGKLQLVHWNSTECEQLAAFLRQAGYTVDTTVPNGPPFLRRLSEDPPDAVLIDLSRMPSRGREVAMSLRMRKSTRYLPLIFLGGEAEKVARIQQVLPDAHYSAWEQVLTTLQNLPLELSDSLYIPQSVFEVYAGTPLPQKLGIKAGARVGLVNVPQEILDLLTDLPAGVTFHPSGWQDCEIILWFVRSQAALEQDILTIAAGLGRGSIWIAWPKKAAHADSDLTQKEVRALGLAHDLVDYKICSIDATWSGLLFTRRQ